MELERVEIDTWRLQRLTMQYHSVYLTTRPFSCASFFPYHFTFLFSCVTNAWDQSHALPLQAIKKMFSQSQDTSPLPSQPTICLYCCWTRNSPQHSTRHAQQCIVCVCFFWLCAASRFLRAVFPARTSVDDYALEPFLGLLNASGVDPKHCGPQAPALGTWGLAAIVARKGVYG